MRSGDPLCCTGFLPLRSLSAQTVFQPADGIPDLAFCALGLAFGFKFGIADDFSSGLLERCLWPARPIL